MVWLWGNTNGIFCVLDGTAKIYNLSLTNAKNHADWTSGFIAKSATAWDSAFEMRNMYIQFAEFFTCWKNSGGNTDFMTSVLIAHENWGNSNVLTYGKFTNNYRYRYKVHEIYRQRLDCMVLP